MVSAGSTFLSQSKIRYLRSLTERYHGDLEEGLPPEQTMPYMRLLFEVEDELKQLAIAASSARRARISLPKTIDFVRATRASLVDDRVEEGNSVDLSLLSPRASGEFMGTMCLMEALLASTAAIHDAGVAKEAEIVRDAE